MRSLRLRANLGGAALALLLAGCTRDAAPWAEAPAASLDLQAHASATTVPLLGDFDVTLDLFRRADLEVTFDPPVPAGTTGTVVLQPEREFGHGRWRRAVLHLRPIQGPGKLVLAPFSAKATDGTVTANSPELTIDVTSLLADAEAALEAPAAPLLPPWSRWWYALPPAMLVLVALAMLLVRRRRRQPPPLPTSIAVPAHVKALRELARLRALPRRTAAEVDAFYVATSQVLRVYLEDRFGLRAPERTTEEFLQEVEAGGPLSVAQCLEVRRFLQQCDLVKFAAQTPAETAHLQTLAIAELLIEATRQDRAPLEASA